MGRASTQNELLEVKEASSAAPRSFRILGLVGFAFLFFWTVANKLPLSTLFDGASLLFVLGGTAALGLVSFSIEQWQSAWQCLLRPNGRFTCGQRRLAAGIFRIMAAYAIGVGAITSLLGIVQLLANLDDPAKIGPGMATVILSCLYGAVLAVMLMVAGTVASSNNDWTTTISSRSLRPVGVAAGAAAGAMAVVIFGCILILWAFQGPT